ncbi:class I SAM-dependent methyltransferase [Marinicella sediminis]|uniref:Class I SAM-dependent methyltransferase n=1 Tax=Marinicella sediminis TaxID=1792834 RepID=A0ABV7JDV8_9GAMM|nr:methyltransferase domain-containing protein [Marinicella sediminis]
MNNPTLTEQLHQCVQLIQTKNINDRTLSEMQSVMAQLQHNDRFMLAYLGDTLKAMINSLKNNQRVRLKKLATVLLARLSAFDHWCQEGNETIGLINSGQINPCSIKPFVRFDQAAYDQYYQEQNKSLSAELKTKQFKDHSNQDFVPIELTKNINHVFRKTYAVNIIETLIGIFRQLGVNEGRWLDVGCGVGYITNAVNPYLYGTDQWQIKGCDLQPSRVAYASKNASAGKQYSCEDAFSLIARLAEEGKKTNVVSMFEFCEHFSDPAKLIRQTCELPVDVVVLGTPLEQKVNYPMNKEPDPVHLWGFARGAMEAIIETTPMDVLLVTETRLGGVGPGLDWLTVVAVSKPMSGRIQQEYSGHG